MSHVQMPVLESQDPWVSQPDGQSRVAQFEPSHGLVQKTCWGQRPRIEAYPAPAASRGPRVATLDLSRGRGRRVFARDWWNGLLNAIIVRTHVRHMEDFDFRGKDSN